MAIALHERRGSIERRTFGMLIPPWFRLKALSAAAGSKK